MKMKVFIFSFVLIALLGVSVFAFLLYDKFTYPLKYTEFIEEASVEFGVKKELIASIINAESKFKPSAVSSKGAVGLMQILPTTAEWAVKQMVMKKSPLKEAFSVSSTVDYPAMLYDAKTNSGELLDPKTNIRIGTWYLAYLLKKFDNISTAICAYNAGEGKVNEWLKNSNYSIDQISLRTIPYKETAKYLNKVKLNLNIYSQKLK